MQTLNILNLSGNIFASYDFESKTITYQELYKKINEIYSKNIFVIIKETTIIYTNLNKYLNKNNYNKYFEIGDCNIIFYNIPLDGINEFSLTEELLNNELFYKYAMEKRIFKSLDELNKKINKNLWNDENFVKNVITYFPYYSYNIIYNNIFKYCKMEQMSVDIIVYFIITNKFNSLSILSLEPIYNIITRDVMICLLKIHNYTVILEKFINDIEIYKLYIRNLIFNVEKNKIISKKTKHKYEYIIETDTCNINNYDYCYQKRLKNIINNNLIETYKNNKEIILEILKYFPKYYQYIENYEIKCDYEIIYETINNFGYMIKYVPEHLHTFDLTLLAVKNNGFALEIIQNKYKTNIIIIDNAINQNGCSIRYANANYKNNKNNILKAVKSNGLAFKYIPMKFKNDLEIINEALNNNGLTLKYIPEHFKNNMKIVNKAVKNNPNAIYYADLECQASPASEGCQI